MRYCYHLLSRRTAADLFLPNVFGHIDHQRNLFLKFCSAKHTSDFFSSVAVRESSFFEEQNEQKNDGRAADTLSLVPDAYLFFDAQRTHILDTQRTLKSIFSKLTHGETHLSRQGSINSVLLCHVRSSGDEDPKTPVSITAGGIADTEAGGPPGQRRVIVPPEN